MNDFREYQASFYVHQNDLMHYGVKGMKWHKHKKRIEDLIGITARNDFLKAEQQRENAWDSNRYKYSKDIHTSYKQGLRRNRIMGVKAQREGDAYKKYSKTLLGKGENIALNILRVFSKKYRNLHHL